MVPRALTDQERELQHQKIINSAKQLVLTYGIKKTSIDDVIKAAGVGKATFYNYFPNKESLLIQLVWEFYRDFVGQAQQMIRNSPPNDLRMNIRKFLHALITDLEKVFFFDNHQELEDLIAAVHPDEMRDFSDMEYQAYENLILMAGLDTRKVKPAIVHNYIHAMYFSVSNPSMMKGDLDETVAVMLDGLLYYLFGMK